MSDLNDLLESLRWHGENAECGCTNVNEDLHEAADTIEQLQQRVGELELKYEGKDLVWFEREEVGELDTEQTGLVSLAEVRARAVEDFVSEYMDKHYMFHLNEDAGPANVVLISANEQANKIRNSKDGE